LQELFEKKTDFKKHNTYGELISTAETRADQENSKIELGQINLGEIFKMKFSIYLPKPKIKKEVRFIETKNSTTVQHLLPLESL